MWFRGEINQSWILLTFYPNCEPTGLRVEMVSNLVYKKKI